MDRRRNVDARPSHRSCSNARCNPSKFRLLLQRDLIRCGGASKVAQDLLCMPNDSSRLPATSNKQKTSWEELSYQYTNTEYIYQFNRDDVSQSHCPFQAMMRISILLGCYSAIRILESCCFVSNTYMRAPTLTDHGLNMTHVMWVNGRTIAWGGGAMLGNQQPPEGWRSDRGDVRGTGWRHRKRVCIHTHNRFLKYIHKT